jgi:hypothetical protein
MMNNEQLKMNDVDSSQVGRIFGCAENRALRGSATAPATAAPWLNPSNPLRRGTLKGERNPRQRSHIIHKISGYS